MGAATPLDLLISALYIVLVAVVSYYSDEIATVARRLRGRWVAADPTPGAYRPDVKRVHLS